MSTNQEGRLAALRTKAGVAAGTLNENWCAAIAATASTGTLNERLLTAINAQLGTSYASLPAAQAAYAINYGFTRWTDQNTLTL